eukprot:scaffold177690_cov19-Tisochrysis_lutea.AAC.1
MHIPFALLQPILQFLGSNRLHRHNNSNGKQGKSKGARSMGLMAIEYQGINLHQNFPPCNMQVVFANVFLAMFQEDGKEDYVRTLPTSIKH